MQIVDPCLDGGGLQMLQRYMAQIGDNMDSDSVLLVGAGSSLDVG